MGEDGSDLLGPALPARSFSQDVRHSPVSARVPERERRGAFCNAVLVQQALDEFVIDFLATMAPPCQLVARVVVTPPFFARVLQSLRGAITCYRQQHMPAGQHAPPAPGLCQTTIVGPQAAAVAAPAPDPETSKQAPPQATSIDVVALYRELTLPDEILAGVFANNLIINYSSTEFRLDFIASFVPRAIVTSRLFFAASRAESFLEAMETSWRAYESRRRGDR